MVGSLIKIDEEIVTSAVASVTLTGIDSTYDVYMFEYYNVAPSTDSVGVNFRFTVGGVAQDTANYDRAYKINRTDTSFSNSTATNQTSAQVFGGGALGNATNETLQGVHYLFNTNNASEYSFATTENVFLNQLTNLFGANGGFVYTVSEAHNGVNLFCASGNIASGTFTLYGLKK